MISIVVCTRNRPGFIGACLRSLVNQGGEVLVVDQSTNDDTGRQVRGFPGVVHHPTPTVGLSRARNIGIRATRGDIVAFTDDDVVADPRWIRNLEEEYARHPDVDILFGRVLPLDESGGGRTFCVMPGEEERRYRRGRVPWGVGGGNNMSFRRRAFDRVGLFDERFGAGARLRGAEDVDIIWRAFAAGLDVLYSPKPVVYHRQWRDPGEMERTTRAYNLANAALLTKHLLAGTPGTGRLLGYRLWHYALAALPGGARRGDWRLARSGIVSLLDHVRGIVAYLQP